MNGRSPIAAISPKAPWPNSAPQTILDMSPQSEPATDIENPSNPHHSTGRGPGRPAKVQIIASTARGIICTAAEYLSLRKVSATSRNAFLFALGSIYGSSSLIWIVDRRIGGHLGPGLLRRQRQQSERRRRLRPTFQGPRHPHLDRIPEGESRCGAEVAAGVRGGDDEAGPRHQGQADQGHPAR